MTQLHLPSQFRLSIGGYFGRSYLVEQSADELIYHRRDESGQELVETVAPTKEQWRAFWKKAERVKIWKWQPKYANPGVCDGTNWSVEIEHGCHTVTSSGNNNYPVTPEEPSFEPEPGKLFKAYLRAVRSLLGGREFS